MMKSYEQFISGRRESARPSGFEPIPMNGNLFDWQARIVKKACRNGRLAIFAECGLGKTLMQLEWARQVVRRTNRPVLLHCPVGVREQTKREADKFGIDCEVVIADSMADVSGASICIANYEKLHKFDPKQFAGCVLDESSILKSFNGKIKKAIVDAWDASDFRLACTATPAPNDTTELGTHAEFLGVMSREQMLSRWFVNDTANVGTWRLKGHASEDFWRWVCSWAVCVSRPSDIGGSDDGYRLPKLIENVHVVNGSSKPPAGMLFDNFALSATNIHDPKRLPANSARSRFLLLYTICTRSPPAESLPRSAALGRIEADFYIRR